MSKPPRQIVAPPTTTLPGTLQAKAAPHRPTPPAPPPTRFGTAMPAPRGRPMLQPKLAPGRTVQRAQVEMVEYRPVPQQFPVGSYRLRSVTAQRSFIFTVTRPARAGGYGVSIAVREPDGTNNPGVLTGDVATATNTAYLNHISVEGIASRVHGLGAVLVYIFACHVQNDANTIVVTTMAPSAAGFYQAVGFPVRETARAYFIGRREAAVGNVGLITQWFERERVFDQAVANPGAALGALPAITPPQRGTAQIIAANAGRVGNWRLVG